MQQVKEKTIISTVHIIFGDTIISMKLWPLHSPEVNPHCFYLRGTFKYKVYHNNTCIEDNVKKRKEFGIVSSILPAEFQCTIKNVLGMTRLQAKRNPFPAPSSNM